MIRFFILACVAIALVQQEADDNHVGNKGQKNANAAQSNASAPAPSHPSPNATDQKPTGDADKRQNNEVQVAIPRKITVEPVKDNIDKVILGCTILLTGVGIAGTCAAIKTLRAINVQAHWMKEHARHLDKVAKAAEANAVAAKKSAEALINSERAWLMVELKGSTWGIKQRVNHDSVPKTRADVKLICRNQGRTPAWITEIHYRLRVENPISYTADIPSDPSETIEMFHPMPVRGKHERALIMYGDGWASGPEETVLYGVVKYRDISGKEHETWFGYITSGDEGVTLERISNSVYSKQT